MTKMDNSVGKKTNNEKRKQTSKRRDEKTHKIVKKPVNSSS